jgi:hypothetical protein
MHPVIDRTDRPLTRRALMGGLLGATTAITGRRIGHAVDSASIPAITGGSKVTVRAKARADSDVRGSLPANTPIRVVAGPTVDGWYRIEADGKRGLLAGWTHGDGLMFT